MSSLVPVQIPCGEISGLTTHQTWCITNTLQFSSGNCSRGLDLQPTTLLANHIHGHIYIPSLGASIQRPHYWGPWWRYFSPFWLSTFPLLALSTPWVHEKWKPLWEHSSGVRWFLLCCIWLTLTRCCSMGENGTLESWRLTLPHCCSKWLKLDCYFWCGSFLWLP